jgi:predicted enzyme related to lactoylglutathione lyase
MGERTSYKPGTFCWIDLSTTDQEAAKTFYQGLFGWDCEDLPVGDGVVYSMMRVDGHDVAAISPQPEMMREAGAPPFWNSYVSVDDADAVAAKAKAGGATLMAEPFDVMSVGRMAVVQDPQGAAFMLWQPRESIGAGLVNAPGALTLNQLNTSDPEAAGRFYADLFGWTVQKMEVPGDPYWGIFNDGSLNAGMMALPPSQMAPPHWLVYFGVDGLEDALRRVGDGGGEVVVPATSVPAGQIAVLRDPQGAYFAFWEGQLDP